jgi:hypothetical protein
MRDVPGKAEHVTRAQIEALADDEDRHETAKAGEELARAGQVRRAAHRRARREIHQRQELLGHRLGHERAKRDAAPPALHGDVRCRPVAHLGPRRCGQLVERNAERVSDFHEHDERRVAGTRLQVGDRRARHCRAFRERVLCQRARTPQAQEVSREMLRDAVGSVHPDDDRSMERTAAWDGGERVPIIGASPLRTPISWTREHRKPRRPCCAGCALP